MLSLSYKNLYSELSPDGGVAGTTSIGTWLKIAPLGLFFVIEISIHPVFYPK